MRCIGRTTLAAVYSVLIIASPPSGDALAQRVRVVSDVLVDATPDLPVEEPHLAIDPRDPNHLLAAAIIGAPAGKQIADQHCAAFSSKDGGAHWTRHDFPIIECYDPWVAFLPDGTALFSSLGRDRALAGDGNGMLVYRSPDGGATWIPRPAGLSWGWDHPMLAVDNSTPRHSGWVYLVSSRDQKKNGSYVVAVARSLDGGKSFDQPRIIAPEGRVVKAESPVVLSDGTLVVSYVEIAEGGLLLPVRRAYVTRSTNGIDFSKQSFVNDVCGPPPDYSQSWLAIDASAGPSRDHLYFACDLPARKGIAVSHSTDRGLTWSDAKSATGDPRAASSPRILMATGVTSKGVFGVVWLEHRPGSPAACADVYISTSLDGERFTIPTRVSQASSCPTTQRNHGVGFGDYFALVPDSRGRFRLAYADARTGLLQLRTALLEVDGPR
jgi:hypothetical protein